MLKALMRSRRGFLPRRIARWCDRLLKAYENVDYDPLRNGEGRVLRCMREAGGTMVFDVGANIGGYTRFALDTVPEAHVHAFEIVPGTFARLQAEMTGADRVTLVGRGLASEAGTLRIKCPAPLSTRASAFDWPDHRTYEWIEAEVIAGDDYCEAHGIGRIDLLKIDVEGAEHLVLHGFRRMLAAGAIRAIQFEYGYVNILTRFLLRDFYELLGAYGYRIGKVYPSYVHFKPYALRDENFWGPNYVAVREQDVHLLDLLGGRV